MNDKATPARSDSAGVKFACLLIVSAGLASALPAKAGILTLNGAFSATFPAGSPMATVSGTWTANVDNSLPGPSNATVSPASFTISPNPFVMDPAIWSVLAQFSTSNVEVYVNMLNGVPTGAILGGTSGGGVAIGGVADFWVIYEDQAAGYGNPLQTYPTGMEYRVLVAGTATNINSVSSLGSATFTETQSVSLAPSGAAQFLGGQSGGGVSVGFTDGYSGTIVVDPFYTTPATAPNFVLALGDGFYWNIDVSGSFTGTAQVAFSYDQSRLLIPESEIAVYHLSDLTGQWEPLPSVVDTQNNIVYATTTSFSPYVLGEAPEANIPEPATLSLLGLGLAGLGFSRRKLT